MSIVAIDLFCGCGGVTRGFTDSGIRVAVGVDFDQDCKETYESNNPSCKFVLKDVSELKSTDLIAALGPVTPEDKLLLSACAPCQPFSQQNRHKGETSERRILTHVARLVRDLQPDFVFLENVYGLKNVRGYSAFRRLLNTLGELGYDTRSGMIDAQEFGVPQSRKRFVLTAVLKGTSIWPEVTHGPGPDRLPFATVRDAISSFPPLEHGQGNGSIPNHIASAVSDLNLKRIKATPHDGGGRQDWPEDLLLKCHESHSGHPDVYGRLSWDKPAPTLTTKCTSISNGRYGHPEQDRAISAREAAALQGFPTDYVFFGGLGALRRLIGNAVPPPVAKQFGASFLSQLPEIPGGARPVSGWRRIFKAKKTKTASIPNSVRASSAPRERTRA